MWDFIWHLRGSAALSADISENEVLDRIERMLDLQQKPIALRSQSELSFDAPLWENLIGPNWLAMVIYDRGSFRIVNTPEGRRLRYDLRSIHGFMFCLAAAAVFAGFGFLNDGLNGAARYSVFAFGWLYGMNMLLAWVRIPHIIAKALTA